MKRAAILTLAMAICWGCVEQKKKQEVVVVREEVYDAQVEHLLDVMTLEEKVGQMTQITLDVVAGRKDGRHVALDPNKVYDAVVRHNVGSILNCAGEARTVENWREIIGDIQDVALRQTRLSIPVIYGIDSIHGMNYGIGATIFPQNIAVAATGNVDIAREIGQISAYETRACGIPWNFNPVLGLGRQPLWPRFYETYGEDAYVASVMGAAYIEGNQGDDISRRTKVAACMKHYVGYSVPLSGRDRTPAYIPERQLRELFLKPFAAAVDAGVATAMINSSEINGIPVHSSRYLLTDVLRGELGFEGFVVSDWADIENLYTREMVARDRREAVKMAVMAGIDMSMVPYDFSFYDTLVDLVKSGEVPMSRIDEAVGRILRVKFDLGLFDRSYAEKSLGAGYGSEASAQVNLEAAREAITVLKNDGDLLPLSRDMKVLVTGPCADKLSVLNGGWTITWQGDQERLYPQEKQTILEAIRAKAGGDNVSFVQGVDFDRELDLSSAIDAGRRADVIVVCVGEPPYCETPGNIDDLTMTAAQLKLVDAMAATGKPVVMVLVEGRPRVIRTVADRAKAIVMAYLPGMEGGRATADILFGDANPSGRLPFSYPRFASYHVTYDHKVSENKGENKYNPQWPFGHGLSYTKFEYSDLKLDMTRSGDEIVGVSVKVTNTGERAGGEVVQVYICDLVASVTPVERKLRGFEKIELLPGQTKTVGFSLTGEDLAFIGRDNHLVLEPGKFKVSVGGLSAEFEVN